MKKKTIVQEHKANFEILKKAFETNNVALMECKEKSTRELVAVICAVNRQADGQFAFVPFAKFFNGNPYELLMSPIEVDEQ